MRTCTEASSPGTAAWRFGALATPALLNDAVIFPPSDCSARVVEPREEALDLPASADATQRSAILGARTATPVCGDHLDALGRHQGVVEAIAVVAAIADQSRWEVSEEPGVEGRGDEVWLIR